MYKRQIYQQLKETSDSLDSLHIGLVDERFVPVTDEKSNERLIRNCFGESTQITGMVVDSEDEVNNLLEVRKRYEPFIEHTDVVILGMGTDGHTASIFPYDPASDDIRRHKREGVFSTKAPNNPTNRITCGIGTLLKAKKIYLVIFGNEKLNILGGLRENLPIHDFLKSREDINIVYA